MTISTSPPMSPVIAPRRLGWAPWAPVACAVHCAITPLLAVVAPPLAPGPAIEWGLLAITTVIASLALRWGVGHHGQTRPVLLAGAGLVAWGISLAGGFEPLPEETTTIVAALLVAGALVWNGRLRCREPVCGPGCSQAER